MFADLHSQALASLFVAVNFYLLVTDAIERSSNHTKAMDWQVKDILFVTVALTPPGIISLNLVSPEK